MKIDARILTVIAIAMAILFAVAFRLVQLMPYPKGAYAFKDSPDGRRRAIVCSFAEMEFFGTETRYYQVRIEPIGDMYVPQAFFREDIKSSLVPRGIDLNDPDAVDEAIQWRQDSVSVTFTLGVKTIVAKAPL